MPCRVRVNLSFGVRKTQILVLEIDPGVSQWGRRRMTGGVVQVDTLSLAHSLILSSLLLLFHNRVVQPLQPCSCVNTAFHIWQYPQS